MTDLATLAIKIDASETDKATSSLDKLTTAGAKAERGVNRFGIEYVKASSEAGKLRIAQMGAASAASTMASEAQKAAARATNMGGSAKLAGHHVQNLAYQVNDLVVGLASGQKPMTVFMQQGSQIAQVMAMAGVGVGGMVKQLASMTVGFLAAHPVLLAVSVAAAAIAGALALVTDEINKNSDVTVTWQDTLLGAFDVVKAAVSSKVTAAFKVMGLDIGDVWNSVVKYTKTAMNLVIGATLVVPKVIAATYDKIGPAFGDAFYRAANLAIEALNTLARAAVLPLNGITKAFNDAFGTKIPAITIEGIGKIANPYAGAMGALGSAGAKAAVGAFSKDYIGDLADVLGDAARNQASLREAAEQGGGKVGKAAGQKAGKAAAEHMAKEWVRDMPDVIKDILKAGETPIDIKFLDIAKEFEERDRRQRELDEANRRRALDTAHDISDIIGGKVGSAIAALADALDRAYPNLMKSLGAKFGGILDSLSSGAQTGGAIAGLGKSLGIKMSTTASQIGGALGKATGIPGADIVASITWGIIGGLLKSTPKASATISIIAGQAMDTVIKGNSGKFKRIVSDMANSMIDSLGRLADELGVTLGDASVSVGKRGKKFVVDPTGQGRTKGPGVVKFGKDEAAAIAFATQDAIKDGVFEGLSEGFKTYLSSGNLEKRLAEVLSLTNARNELASMKDPTGFALSELDKEVAKLRTIATATGEGLVEVEEYYGLKRAEIAKQAAQAAFEAARPAREQEIRILELLGKDTEALTASRALELEGMDPLLREKQQYIHRLEDEATATAKMNAIAEEQRAINLRYYQAAGNEAKVLEITRAAELAAVSEGNRALLLSVYAREDEARATDAATKAAQEAAEAAKRIADERQGLQDQIDTLLGNTAALRERERAALDISNRAMFDRVEALKAEATEAARVQAIADERAGLMQQLWQVTGDTAALQAAALEKLDPSNRELQKYIWSLEAAKAATEAQAQAQEEWASRVNELRSQLTEAYNRESGALQGTIDKFNGFARSIADFRDNLIGGINPAVGFAAAQRRFRSTSAMAGLGNEASLSAFTGDAQGYLEAAKMGTYAQYRRALADVLAGSNGAISGASSMAGAAAKQLSIMTQQYEKLVKIEDAQVSFTEALKAYEDATRTEVIPAMTQTITTSIDNLSAKVEQADSNSQTNAELIQTALNAIAVSNNKIERLWSRVIQEDTVRTEVITP